MTPRHLIRTLSAFVLIGASALLPTLPARAQIAVYDPANYAQNVLTATRALQQINNQIQSLQNEATMLTNMAKQLQKLDFSSLSEISSSMQKISTLMTQADGIALNLSSTETALSTLYPQSFSTSTSTSAIVSQAQQQWQASMASYRQTMQVQAQVAENVQSDNDLLAQLVTQSQAADGGLQAQQAANQLTAMAIKQQLQIQSLMATQDRAAALELARQADALEAARTTTTRFVGAADIYTRP